MASAGNPNVCVGCEQLLVDDSAELERLLEMAPPSVSRSSEPVERWERKAVEPEPLHADLATMTSSL